jgi:hypothetical protein
MKDKKKSFRWVVTGVWIICCLLAPGKLAAQAQPYLYAEIDNFIKIDVPGVPFSMLEISATGGTIKQTKSPYENVDRYTIIDKSTEKYKRYKKGVSTYWIAHPAWVLAEFGQRPEFVVTASVKMGGTKKVLATQRYALKTAFFINARKETYTITSEDLLKDDIILINSNMVNVFNLIYYVPNGQSVSPAADHPGGRFTEKEKQVIHDMKTGSKMYIKFPSNTKKPPIELIMGE